MIDLPRLTADAISFQRLSANEYKDARRYANDARKWSFMPEAHTRAAKNFQIIAAHDAYAARQALLAIITINTFTTHQSGYHNHDPI